MHFNSHIDVVEPGIGWTYDPFAADVVGDRIYGRGACDMKGGLAASVIAVEALIELAPDLAGNLEINRVRTVPPRKAAEEAERLRSELPAANCAGGRLVPTWPSACNRRLTQVHGL